MRCSIRDRFFQAARKGRLIAAACYPAAMRENPNDGIGKAASRKVKETAQAAK